MFVWLTSLSCSGRKGISREEKGERRNGWNCLMISKVVSIHFQVVIKDQLNFVCRFSTGILISLIFSWKWQHAFKHNYILFCIICRHFYRRQNIHFLHKTRIFSLLEVPIPHFCHHVCTAGWKNVSLKKARLK